MTGDDRGRPPQRLFEVAEVRKRFDSRRSLLGRHRPAVHAVNGVSFQLREGETLGLVGESGSGKSTMARLLLGLDQPTSGRVRYRERNLSELDKNAMRAFRREVQMVFQDPFGTLDPRMTVAQIVSEPWEIFPDLVTKADRHACAAELLERVGLQAEHLGRYPIAFSGGQRQRINIARALALNPRVLVCDEPVSALDVSIQAQILNLLADIRAELGLAMVFISHDLAVVREVCENVAVMQLGAIVESGPTREVYASPQHPYTQALLSAVPRMDAFEQPTDRIPLPGAIASGGDLEAGCSFRTRCWKAAPQCAERVPPLEVRDGTHRVACFFPGSDNEGQRLPTPQRPRRGSDD
jgi:oligopeptide transport system ATP-binding protein